MKNKADIFIRMLEMGVELKGAPITFKKMLATLRTEYPIIIDEQIPVLRRWFYDHYYHPATFRINKGATSSNLPDGKLEIQDNESTFFSGDGYYKYIQYEELQAAHLHAQIAEESAKSSNRMALIAIGITMVIGLVSIFLSLY